MASKGKVLIIDYDLDLADLLAAILTDEGYTVSILADVETDAIRSAVGKLEPDCVLLDAAVALATSAPHTAS